MESLDSLSVDIARMIDHDAAAELWDRYKRGERNVFTRRLYTMQGQKTFEEIRKQYRGDREFKQTVDRYIGEFERLLEEVSHDDRGQVVARTYLTSETGKVYTMLAHAAGRLRISGTRQRNVRRARLNGAPFCFSARLASRHAPLAHRPHRALADRRRVHDRRGAKTEAQVVVAEVSDGRHTGRGECVPYARYGETVAGVMAALGAIGSTLAPASTARRCSRRCRRAPRATRSIARSGISRPSARQGRSMSSPGCRAPQPLVTAYTISLGTPQAMADAAGAAAARKLLKVKLGGEGDPERIAAVRQAAPNAELIVDANEGWSADNLAANLAACAEAGVTLVEQPLPAGDDAALAAIPRPIPVCADESVHDRVARRARRQIRRGQHQARQDRRPDRGAGDGAGGRAARLRVMVGCMVATSLAMAPAMLLAQRARVVDLDGPLLLARDRADGLRYEGSLVYPPTPALWG